jgi:hypothetical protein
LRTTFIKNQQENLEELHSAPGTSSTVSSGSTLSRLLEMERSIDGYSSVPVYTSLVEPYQGYGQGNRPVNGIRMMRDDEQIVGSSTNRHTYYLSETHPSTPKVTTPDRGVIYLPKCL